MIICSIHCPPGLDNVFTADILDFKTDYSVDDLLTSLATLRFYLLLRLAAYFTRYTKEKAERVC